MYTTGNYSQHPVINHNGNEYEKECVYIHTHIKCIPESLCYAVETNTL